MDIVKKNLLSIVCGVVALMALVAYFFYPIGSLFEGLQTQVNGRTATASSIDATLNKKRTLPVVRIGETPQDLGVFPTPEHVRVAKGALDQLALSSGEAYQMLVKQQEAAFVPLIPGVLPEPKDLPRESAVRSEFQAAYLKAMTPLEGNPPPIAQAPLDATFAPTADVVRQATERLAAEIEKRDTLYDTAGKPSNAEAVKLTIKRETADFPAKLRLQNAVTKKVYISPTAFVIHPAMLDREPPSMVNIFNAQLTYWMQSVVAQSVASVNAGSKNVLSSPIKRIVALEVTDVMNFGGGGATAASTPRSGFQGGAGYQGDFTPDATIRGSGGGAPAPTPSTPATPAESGTPAVATGPEVPVDPAADLAPNLTKSAFGQTSNAFYEPTHITLTLDVDAARLPMVLDRLPQNHLLYINNVQLTSLDPGTLMAEGYIYGNSQVVRITLDCDLIFLRAFLVPMMPNDVKTYVIQKSSPAVAPQ